MSAAAIRKCESEVSAQRRLLVGARGRAGLRHTADQQSRGQGKLLRLPRAHQAHPHTGTRRIHQRATAGTQSDQPHRQLRTAEYPRIPVRPRATKEQAPRNTRRRVLPGLQEDRHLPHRRVPRQVVQVVPSAPGSLAAAGVTRRRQAYTDWPRAIPTVCGVCNGRSACTRSPTGLFDTDGVAVEEVERSLHTLAGAVSARELNHLSRPHVAICSRKSSAINLNTVWIHRRRTLLEATASNDGDGRRRHSWGRGAARRGRRRRSRS